MLLVPGIQSHVRWDAMVGGYVRSIEEADRKVGRLLTILQKAGVLDDTMVIVTSDHGQAFGEMGNVYHGTGATDSVTRVPLVVAAPEGVSVPRRIDRWVSLCEVDSWIRSVAAGGVPYDEDGRAPSSHDRFSGDAALVFSEGPPVSDANRSMRGLGLDQFWSHRLLAAYRGAEKLVLDTDTGEILRWETNSDPDSTPPSRISGNAAVTLRQEVFQAYERKDASRAAQVDSTAPAVDLEIDERLRSWGYD
jgi:hypothetical protein